MTNPNKNPDPRKGGQQNGQQQAGEQGAGLGEELDLSQQGGDLRPDAGVARVDEDQPTAVRLMQQMLEEANQTNRAQPFESAKHKTALRRLIGSFRHLCTLRGDDFNRAFVLFQEAAREREGVFHPILRNRALELATAGAEREAFTIFLNMVVRYARAKPQQKAAFAANNNVDRLLAVIADDELRSLMAEAFGAQ
jgi:hypothetical protein